MKHPVLVVATVAFSLTTLAPAQAAWNQLAPLLSPSPRAGTHGITDGASFFLFGGKPGPGVELNDLWQYSAAAGNWTDITPTTGPLPPTRDFYGAAYDTGRGRYVLFGGRSGAATLGDTWEFDGTSWTQMTPANSPAARRWAPMIFDAVRGESILFGGYNGTVYNNETWSWDGTNWTQKTPAQSPSVRGRGRMSYDLTRAEVIFYGGRDVGGALGDTWKWDGTDWSQVATATNGPGSFGVAGLFAFGMTYDLLRDRHVIFGGTRTGATLSNTWEFDGTDWSQRTATGPGNRTGCALAFVIADGTSYMFGGYQGPQYNDTWEYQTSPIATTTALGGACTGSGGLLSLVADNAPWVGGTFSATISNLATGSLVFNVIGLSNTTWAGGALPVALGLLHPAGGPGCSLVVSNDAVVLLVASGGMAATALALPNSVALAGVLLHQQALEIELDPSFNITSINSTNGLSILIGAR